MIPDCLETTNLSLRPFSLDDDEAVFNYWQSDPGWERYNASVPSNFTLDDARKFVREMCARSRDTSPNWAILHQGRVVGVVSLTFEQNDRFAVIGYGIHGGLSGRGFSTQAASKIVDEAFKRYPNLHKIRAHTDATNAPSIRVLEKLGFSREVTLQKSQLVKGRFVDEAVYSLFREDWRGD
ncbi:MAG: GNAT family N-acetyltransferase [Pseudomonadales bacterium]